MTFSEQQELRDFFFYGFEIEQNDSCGNRWRTTAFRNYNNIKINIILFLSFLPLISIHSFVRSLTHNGFAFCSLSELIKFVMFSSNYMLYQVCENGCGGDTWFDVTIAGQMVKIVVFFFCSILWAEQTLCIATKLLINTFLLGAWENEHIATQQIISIAI